jgi:diguanylate cyclase (GGDEF)-like protein/PAS domain S-box-containing protein
MAHPSSAAPVLEPRQVEALLEVTRALLRRPAEESTFGFVLAQAVAVIPGAEAGSIVVRDEADGRYRFVATVGFDLQALRGFAFDEVDILADVAPDGRATVIRDPDRRNAEVLPVERHRALSEAGDVASIRATVAVPVVLDGEVVATFRLDSKSDPDAFDAAACRAAEAFGDQIALVLGRLRQGSRAAREAAAYRELYETARRQAQELELLDRLRQAVARGRELDEVLRLTVEAIAEALRVPLVSAYLRERDALRLRHAVGYARVVEVLALGAGITGRVAATGEAALVHDVTSDVDFLRPSEAVVSEVAVPIVADGDVVGVLNAESCDRRFGEDDLRLLSAIRDQVGVAVQRARLLEAVQASERRFRLLAEHARDLVCLHDPDGRMTYVSPSSQALLGWPPEGLVGRLPFEVIDPEDHDLLTEVVRDPLHAHQPIEPVTFRVRTRDGRTVWLESSVQPVLDDAGRLVAAVSASRDVTERKGFEERLRRGALYDDLTGLPNRALLLDRLDHAIERHRRDPALRYAVLFLDLDRFKLVNDSLGHAVGDTLLQAIAGRLRDVVRSGDTVARLGGDEFCVLLEDLVVEEEAERTAARLQATVARPFAVAGRELYASVSVGVAHARPTYATSADVLRDADIAMYRSKSSGTGRHAVFDVAMHDQAVARLELETQLRQALTRGEVRAAFQPVVRLADGVVVGFEALARWDHPTRGELPPEEFVPLAEESTLIVALDRAVASAAAAAMARWRAAGRHWTLSVNVSAHHFTIGDVAETTEAVLAASGLDPAALRLEITESALMAHPDQASRALDRLRRKGTLVQVDDFGTGYSSLAYLQQLPIDALKLDRSFVTALSAPAEGSRRGGAAGAREIVAAVVNLARNLRIDVVAEGIEDAEQASFLAQLGCGYGQGFRYAPPLAEADVLGWADARASAADGAAERGAPRAPRNANP